MEGGCVTDLKPKRPLEGLNETIGDLRIAALDPGRVTSVAPYPGRDPDASLAALGLRFPAPGEIHAAHGARIVWAGRQLAFLIGTEPPENLSAAAALTDQSDGWAWVHVTGSAATEVLARLCPLDLRLAAFPPGTAAKSLIGHMQALIVRTSESGFEVAVFASMAGTLRHDLEAAAKAIAARQSL
jgi:heterotetrameric sarcosine oxidase gamma subunit